MNKSPRREDITPKEEYKNLLQLVKDDFKLLSNITGGVVGRKRNMIRDEASGQEFAIRDVENHFKTVYSRLKELGKYIKRKKGAKKEIDIRSKKLKGAIFGIVFIGDPLYEFLTTEKERFGYLDPMNKSKGLLIDALTTLVKEKIALRVTILTLLNLYVARNDLKSKEEKKRIVADEYMNRFFGSKKLPAIYIPGKSKENTAKVHIESEMPGTVLSVYDAIRRIDSTFNPSSFDLKYFQLLITTSVYTTSDLEGVDSEDVKDIYLKMKSYEENGERLIREYELLKESHSKD